MYFQNGDCTREGWTERLRGRLRKGRFYGGSRMRAVPGSWIRKTRLAGRPVITAHKILFLWDCFKHKMCNVLKRKVNLGLTLPVDTCFKIYKLCLMRWEMFENSGEICWNMFYCKLVPVYTQLKTFLAD